MTKNIKGRLLKTISLQLQILFFIIFSLSAFYILLNINTLSPILPGGEDESIKLTAQNAVIPDQKFQDLIVDIKPEEYISGLKTTDKENYLKIDRILIEAKITEGSKENEKQALLNGFWRYPDGSDPSKGNTTVIFGHRRAKLPPLKDTMYNLDKVKLGDLIESGYSGKIYYYKVIDIKIVEASDWSATSQSGFDSIKLITCTPLGSDKQRIVVTAKKV